LSLSIWAARLFDVWHWQFGSTGLLLVPARQGWRKEAHQVIPAIRLFFAD
jgi:hypothetical protein